MASTQGIKLDDDIKQRLKELGKVRDRSPHWLMRAAIEDFLEREENYEREKREDQERWDHYQLTGEYVSHEAAMEWMDSLARGENPPCPK